ncbi:neo [Drosophila busckii]|uniref:Neo n=1 Tax=Drosophila busckii TaxID=30019 RepID=A0A0M4EME8_DROBS|nr:neo [Drosophila busckii]
MRIRNCMHYIAIGFILILAVNAGDSIDKNESSAVTELPLETETTTEIPVSEDAAPDVQNRNSAIDSISTSDYESKEFASLTDTKENDDISSSNELCDPDAMGFEIVTGYVFSAPGKLMDSLPGTLMLTDCLSTCHKNKTCQSVNYETGLCVLFSSNADQLPGALTKSQFPVFTIYAQKSCVSAKPCNRAWYIDRVQNYRLKAAVKRSALVSSRRECFELCLSEAEFTCRSANYKKESGVCELSEMDRSTLAGANAFEVMEGTDYLENHCVEEPNKLCEFKRLQGRILKTVDSVYQDVSSVDECRELCLNSPFRCHSYDYNDTGDMVCRLSHHSRATLSDVQDPYLEVPEASTYELASCYNVTIECGGGDMLARIRTSKLFSGKVYAKGSPKSCAVDVRSALDFELRMNYNDLECNVRHSNAGRYVNDIIIQHHDMIVTSSDLGLALACQYDLSNKSVTNGVNLDVRGDLTPALSEEVIVDSPSVVMRVTSRDGSDMLSTAEVGDPLALKFQIMDEQSPYEIFVRELVALDGIDNSEITLIDSNGCPTDHFIMGPIYKNATTGKILLSNFDAFKFPSSEVVQFRALVSPCMPSCEPVQCDQEDTSGEYRSTLSFGRKRHVSDKRIRRQAKSSSAEEMLLVQSIQITDKFGFEELKKRKPHLEERFEENETTFTATEGAQGFCVNAIGLITAATIFLLTQLSIIGIWTFCYQRRQKLQAYHHSY